MIALGEQDRAARMAGLKVRSKILANCAYTEKGILVSREKAGAALHNSQTTAKYCTRMVWADAIKMITGVGIPVMIV